MKQTENAELEELRLAVAAADRYFGGAAEAWIQADEEESGITPDGVPYVGENVSLDLLAKEAGELVALACDRWKIRREGGMLPEVAAFNESDDETKAAVAEKLGFLTEDAGGEPSHARIEARLLSELNAPEMAEILEFAKKIRGASVAVIHPDDIEMARGIVAAIGRPDLELIEDPRIPRGGLEIRTDLEYEMPEWAADFRAADFAEIRDAKALASHLDSDEGRAEIRSYAFMLRKAVAVIVRPDEVGAARELLEKLGSPPIEILEDESMRPDQMRIVDAEGLKNYREKRGESRPEPGSVLGEQSDSVDSERGGPA